MFIYIYIYISRRLIRENQLSVEPALYTLKSNLEVI